MTSFAFDDTKSFDDNLEAFLGAMDTVDPEMASVLRRHTAKLFATTANGPPDRKARAAFNDAVLGELEKLMASPEAK